MPWLPITSYCYIFLTKTTNTLSRTFITFVPQVFSCLLAYYKRQRLHRLRFVTSDNHFYSALLEKVFCVISLSAYFMCLVLILFHVVLMASCTISTKQPASTSQYVVHKQVKVDSLWRMMMMQERCAIDSLFSTCRACTEYPTTAYFSRHNQILLQEMRLVFKFYCKFV